MKISWTNLIKKLKEFFFIEAIITLVKYCLFSTIIGIASWFGVDHAFFERQITK